MFKTQAEFNRSCYRVGVEEALRLTHGFFPVKFDQFEEMSEAHNMIFRVFQDEARKRLEKACDDISEKCKDNKRNYEQIEKAKNILLKIKEPEIDWNIIEEEPIKLSSYDEVKKVG